MSSFTKKCIKKAKLVVLWFRRILFAPNHFSEVGFFTKLRMNVCGGYLADQYALYDFKSNDCREYLSEFDWYRSRWINEPFDQMCNNKIICTNVLDPYVTCPKLLFMKNHGRMVSLEFQHADGYKSTQDVVELLRQYGSLFMKPLAAGKGKGVRRLDLEDGQLMIDTQPVSIEQFDAFLTKEDGWFLSEGMKQSAFEDGLYDKTTNTIRFITMRDPDSGDFKVFFAVQRIGTSATIPVDNGSRGGLVAKIDLETGELSQAHTMQQHGWHKVHPDSGAPIEGAVIPNWGRLKEDMLTLARRFPFMNFIAWDILLTDTPEGFCIVEANTSSGVNIIQLFGPQRNGELGDFYRAHGVIK